MAMACSSDLVVVVGLLFTARGNLQWKGVYRSMATLIGALCMTRGSRPSTPTVRQEQAAKPSPAVHCRCPPPLPRLAESPPITPYPNRIFRPEWSACSAEGLRDTPLKIGNTLGGPAVSLDVEINLRRFHEESVIGSGHSRDPAAVGCRRADAHRRTQPVGQRRDGNGHGRTRALPRRWLQGDHYRAQSPRAHGGGV